MIEYRIAEKEDIELVMSSRMEMLRVVNSLDEDYQFSDEFTIDCKRFFLNGDQTTVLAMDGDTVVGCASICYYALMPTFSHPAGKRAYLMNVYTKDSYRRMGIAKKMVSMLIEEAWARETTEISLDATESGRILYQRLGFVDSDECMVLDNMK